MINGINQFAALNSSPATGSTQHATDLQAAATQGNSDETRAAFDKFVGGTFYRQMLSSMQKTVGKAAYFDGGQAEEMFRSELNSQLADNMAAATAHQLTGPMYELFSLQRS